MRIIVIHAESGDTLAAVVRLEELNMMGVAYTELVPDEGPYEILEGNPDLCEDLDLLLTSCLAPESFGISRYIRV
jgi:hypothetical protein